jgi:hypothetical protein
LEARETLGTAKCLRLAVLILCLRACFKINESKQTVFKLFSPKSSGILRRVRFAKQLTGHLRLRFPRVIMQLEHRKRFHQMAG